MNHCGRPECKCNRENGCCPKCRHAVAHLGKYSCDDRSCRCHSPSLEKIRDAIETEGERRLKEMQEDPEPSGEEKCNCKEMSCKENCTERHTHKGFFCEICEPSTSSSDEEDKIQEGLNKLYGPSPKEDWEKRFREMLFTWVEDYKVAAEHLIPFIKKEIETARGEVAGREFDSAYELGRVEGRKEAMNASHATKELEEIIELMKYRNSIGPIKKGYNQAIDDILSKLDSLAAPSEL